MWWQDNGNVNLGSKQPTRKRFEFATVAPPPQHLVAPVAYQHNNCIAYYGVIMLRSRCGLQKIESIGEFFCRAYLKKGEKLHKHAFSVEKIIDGLTNEVKAKCVLQVRLNVVYDISLQASGASLHFTLE